jgi:hypothetical protein
VTTYLLSFHGVADGGFEESQLYYTTPQAKKQAGNAGDSQHMLKTSKKDNGEFEVQTLFPGSDRYGVTRFVS